MGSVSVIVATYGDLSWAQKAEKAAASARPQLLATDELIQVHGGGDTLQHARNNAAAEATCEWLCFLDADDLLEPGYLDAMRPVMDTAPEKAVLIPACRFVVNGRSNPPSIPNTNPRRPLVEINRIVVGAPVRRSLFEEIGGFGPEDGLEDWILWLRAEQAGAELIEVPEAVYRINHSNSGRNAKGNTVQAYWEIRRRFDPALQSNEAYRKERWRFERAMP